MTPAERMAEIEQRRNAVDTAPWHYIGEPKHYHIKSINEQFAIASNVFDEDEAAFITAAPNDYDWLLARVRQLEDGLENRRIEPEDIGVIVEADIISDFCRDHNAAIDAALNTLPDVEVES
jgi:hypothetical protein